MNKSYGRVLPVEEEMEIICEKMKERGTNHMRLIDQIRTCS